MILRVRKFHFQFRHYATHASRPQDDVFIIKVDSPRSVRLKLKRPKMLAIKDNISTSNGITTTCASSLLTNYQSPFEAEVLTKFCSNGEFEIMGKSKMDEFGMGSNSTHSIWGPVRRKAAKLRDFSPGGSSGGSAVAVADNHCELGIGTDTGGSVRLPAAYTGIIGFKPSYGLISRWGVVPYANSLDTIGFLSRSVGDSEEAFKLCINHDSRDPTSLTAEKRKKLSLHSNETYTISNLPVEEDLKPFPCWLQQVTLGYPLEYNITEIDPEIRRVWKLTLKLFRAVGVKIVPISLPMTKFALPAYYILAPAEAASNLAKYDGIRYGIPSNDSRESEIVLYSTTRGIKLGPEVRRRILLGSYTLCSEKINNYYIQAQKVRRLIQRDFDRVFKLQNPLRDYEQFDISQLHHNIPVLSRVGPETVDFILSPTAPAYPPLLSEVFSARSVDTYMNDVFTVPSSLAGLPSLTIPVKLSDEFDFAVGMQLIGQYGTDFQLLRLGRQFELLVQHARKVFQSEKRNNNKKLPSDL
ncbi:putative glutamyl-trna amidotransferase subunit a [Erysiphe necator]|uniref:Glutamyl-tRNA(Gln) amidotransferase subunit A, mitochondrial n=1 Tax=Uncinula necator TaxID=52586 RepID=A0A0B1P3K5_UNCNE|nr:putative glutamyl-trna amidotransferase subunit a [Erysiphe necator]